MTVLEIDPTKPPALQCNKPISRSIQLSTSAAQSDVPFTVNQMLKLQLMCVSTTLGYSLAYAIRIRRVRLWAAANALGATTTVAVEWNAGSTGFLLDGVSASDTTVSSTEPAYVDTRPPRNSLASWYQAGTTGGTNELFSITCPGGTLIRIDYDYVLNTTEPAFSGGFAITAGVQGLLVAVNPSSTIVVNVPLNSIF